MFSDEYDPGLLIAFEGMDGSGKTTQRKLLRAWLENNGEEVVVSKWNSSALFKDLIKAKKRAHLLNPIHYAVLHAAGFPASIGDCNSAVIARREDCPRRPLHFYRHYSRCGPRDRPELDN